jgi:hypothetical protein
MGCAFYLIVYIMNVRDEYNSTLFKASDCGTNVFEQDQALEDWFLPLDQQQGAMACYCFQ